MEIPYTVVAEGSTHDEQYKEEFGVWHEVFCL